MGIEPTVYHMNEGHSAFLALERLRRLKERRRLSFAEARELASASLVFTTHTPVDAGHDRFAPEQVRHYFGAYAQRLGLNDEEFLALGRTGPQDRGDFCMTVLARASPRVRTPSATSRRRQPQDVAVALAERTGGRSADQPHHQWRALPELDFARDESTVRSIPGSELARGAGQQRRLEPRAVDTGGGAVAHA